MTNNKNNSIVSNAIMLYIRVINTIIVELYTLRMILKVLRLNGKGKKAKAGNTRILPEHWHAIKTFTKLTFVEVQSGNPLVKEDIERSDWDW